MAYYGSDALRAKVEAAPSAPGCYLFFDRAGRIIYVGKSKRLRDRVRSYFGEAARSDERTAKLVREIHDAAFIPTETELDALVEEYLRIKRHRPWFNAQHIRDMRPHFVRVDGGKPYPSVAVTREALPDGAAYLGPFADSHRAAQAVEALNAIWYTPLCGRADWDGVDRPCLYHGLHRCPAPCGGLPGEAARRLAAEMMDFLRGRPEAAMARLDGEMRAAAAALRFEAAGAAKDRLALLERLGRGVAQGFHIAGDTHAALLARGYGERAYSAFYIRGGRVCGRVRLAGDEPAGQAADALLAVARAETPSRVYPPNLAACLSEIAAYKRFLPLATPPDRARLRAGFAAFLAGNCAEGV